MGESWQASRTDELSSRPVPPANFPWPVLVRAARGTWLLTKAGLCSYCVMFRTPEVAAGKLDAEMPAPGVSLAYGRDDDVRAVAEECWAWPDLLD